MNQSPRSIADTALRLMRRLEAARDVEEALRVLLDEAVAATGVDVCAVYRWDVEQTLLVRVSATPPPPDFEGTARPGQGTLGEVVERRARQVLGGSAAGPVDADDRQRWGLQSVVAVPLLHGDGLSGVVVVGRWSADPPPDGDVDVLDLLAALAAPVLALTEATGQEATARRRYDALTRAARELAHDLNNDLTMPIGALELMRERDDMPPDVQELIAAAAEDLTRIEARIRAFQQVARG